MTERVTLKPGDYVRTEGMTEDEYHAVARAFIEAGCPRREYPDVHQMRDMELFGWASSLDSPNKGLWHSANTVFHQKGRHLTIDQVLTATNAGGQAKDTLTTILESAAEHDAKAKRHAAEHERMMQQARDMLPDGWRLVRAEDMVQAVTEDPREWIKGNIDQADGSVQTVTLTEDVSLAPTQDMSDPANWRPGDMVECAFDYYIGYSRGCTYQVSGFASGSRIPIIDEDGDAQNRMTKNFRFHHRPNT